MRGLAILGIVLAASLAAAGAHALAAGWPPRGGSGQTIARQVAAHVTSRYYLSEYGGRLVTVRAGKAELKTDSGTTPLNAVVVRKGTSNNAIGYATRRAVLFTLCGTSKNCSIPGTATETRGRLIRRVALELALDTFTYAPSVDSVLVFAPPAPGKTVNFVVYLRRADLREQLGRPLRKTLPVDPPPFPADPDKSEAKTIDRLTLPHTYAWTLAQIKTAGAAIVLDTFTAPTSQGR